MRQPDLVEHDEAQVRITLSHGVVQHLCNSCGADSLHIKGLALDPRLRHEGRRSLDVDLLVRPSHVDRMGAALRAHDWHRVGRFATGSPFEHAENWHHDVLGHLDLHRLIPGVGLSAEDAFDVFWTDRLSIRIADVECPIPSLDMQSVIVLLHAARSHGSTRARRDVDHLWGDAGDDRRERVFELVHRLHAEVAFAAAIGDLDRFQNRPEYLLWKVNSSPRADRTTEWWARIRAAAGPREKALLALRSVLVNRDHLRAIHLREPTRMELLMEFVSRAMRATHELTHRRDSR